jgi:hypothetical protein
MSRKRTPTNINDGKATNRDTFYVAILGLIGTVIVAIIGIINTRTQILLPVSLTQTAEASKALLSNTLVSTVLINTPENTPTEILPTSTSALLPKQDFSTNCISATDWTPSPKSSSFSKGNDCWDLSRIGIVAQNGELFFAVQNSEEQKGAIYTPVPKEGIISFSVKIDTFISGKTNGNLAFGVGTADNWLSKGKFVFFRATDSGYYIVYGGEITEVGKNTIDAYKIGSDVVVTYEFKNLVFDIYVNDTKIVSDIPLSSSPQVFWIGYRLLPNSKLVAYVSDFRLEK